MILGELYLEIFSWYVSVCLTISKQRKDNKRSSLETKSHKLEKRVSSQLIAFVNVSVLVSNHSSADILSYFGVALD